MSLTDEELEMVFRIKYPTTLKRVYGPTTAEWAAAVERVLRPKIADEIRALVIPAYDETMGPVSAAASTREHAARIAEGMADAWSNVQT